MNTDPLADKWRAFGLQVTECRGNDMQSVVETLETLPQNGKPNVVIANTEKVRGSRLFKGVWSGTTGCQKVLKLIWRWRN